MVKGYSPVPSYSPQGTNYINDLLQQISGFLPQAAHGYQQFLPGGGGGQPIIDQAMQRYQQQTIPSIMNAFGSEAGIGSSALNQALASSAANLNTDLSSQLAQMQMSAAGGLGQLGIQGGSLGMQGSQQTYMPNQQSFLKQLLLSLIPGLGTMGGGFFR